MKTITKGDIALVILLLAIIVLAILNEGNTPLHLR